MVGNNKKGKARQSKKSKENELHGPKKESGFSAEPIQSEILKTINNKISK